MIHRFLSNFFPSGFTGGKNPRQKSPSTQHVDAQWSQGRCRWESLLWKNPPARMTSLVASTQLKNISRNGNPSQIGAKIKNIWNHHLDESGNYLCSLTFCFCCLQELKGATRQSSNGYYGRIVKNVHVYVFLLPNTCCQLMAGKHPLNVQTPRQMMALLNLLRSTFNFWPFVSLNSRP